MYGTEEFQMGGKFLSVHVPKYRVKLTERIKYLRRKVGDSLLCIKGHLINHKQEKLSSFFPVMFHC